MKPIVKAYGGTALTYRDCIPCGEPFRGEDNKHYIFVQEGNKTFPVRWYTEKSSHIMCRWHPPAKPLYKHFKFNSDKDFVRICYDPGINHKNPYTKEYIEKWESLGWQYKNDYWYAPLNTKAPNVHLFHKPEACDWKTFCRKIKPTDQFIGYHFNEEGLRYED